MDNKKTIISVIFLILIIIGLGGYIVYDKFFFEKEEITTTTINNTSINLNVLYQIGETLERFDKAFNGPSSTYFGYIYNTKRIEASNFDMGAALFASMAKDFERTNSTQSLMGFKVKNNFTSIFGNYLKYTPSNVSAGDNYVITYDENTNTYSYVAPPKSDVYSAGYQVKNIKTSLAEDTIVVRRKVLYVEYENKEGTIKAIIYKNASKGQKIGEVSLRNGELSMEEVLAKYGSKLNTFDYTFKQQSLDDYSFYKIEQK